MSKKFVIVLNSGTPAEQNLLTQRLVSLQWAYFHYLEDVWLLAGVPDAQTAKTIYADAALILGEKTILVFEVQGECEHFGRANPKAWPWLKEHWGPVAT